MAYVKPELVERAKEIDLLTYLQVYEPENLVHFGGNTYCTREHDSLKISNGKWFWFSRRIGGWSALDYLVKVKGMSFTGAVQLLSGQVAALPPVSAYQPKQEEPKGLQLPRACRDNQRVLSYLRGRGIDREILQFCVSTGRIYESFPYHSAVFVGHDAQGNAKYAAIRGVDSNFKGEARGSDKRFSFSLPAEKGSCTVHLFEAAIDLLSFATMAKLAGRDWRSTHLLSLAGVYQPGNTGKNTIPLALSRFLMEHPEVQNIVLRLDNDEPGRLAAAGLQGVLAGQYRVHTALPPQGKDYNDCLRIRLGLPPPQCNRQRGEAR